MVANERAEASGQRVLLIANPVSGGGRGLAAAERCATELRRLGAVAEVYRTVAAGDAQRRAAAAAHEPWTTLVAVGGDGTVNEVLGGMGELRQRLAMLPVGTANVLAIELRLPRRPEALAAAIVRGRTRQLAVGLANGRRFVLFCGVGLDGAVVHRLATTRSGTCGKVKWLAPILHTLWHWPRCSLRATFGDGSVREGLGTVLVTRVRDYGGVVKLPASIDVDDGRLHVVCFRARSRLAWLWLGLCGLCRCMRPGRWLEVVPTDSVRIEGHAWYQLDGDAGAAAPVDVTLDRYELQFVVADGTANRGWARRD